MVWDVKPLAKAFGDARADSPSARNDVAYAASAADERSQIFLAPASLLQHKADCLGASEPGKDGFTFLLRNVSEGINLLQVSIPFRRREARQRNLVPKPQS